MPDTRDEIIMQNVKNGNLSEMSVLFERYHVRLFNFFLKLTRNRELSQDLTQNLFYRMLKYKATYNTEMPVKTWIYQIARNLYYDHCKGEQKENSLFLKSEDIPSDVPEKNDMYTEEDFVRLESAMAELSNEQREIIVLSRYQGLKYEEISRITNQSVASIKVTVHRAIKQLRGMYFKQL